MKVRFGFVAMAESLSNASPSGTMTVKSFLSLPDREGALLKLTRIAERNLENSLRILRHAHASGVSLYRFSSKLIPLYTHAETQGWNFLERLDEPLQRMGEFVRSNGMRVSFHPDHFTVLNSPKTAILSAALTELQYHEDMFKSMGLGSDAKFVLHIGGGYKDKMQALRRFADNWTAIPGIIQERITIENDDKIFTARDAGWLAKELGVPAVFDLHHHICNNEEDEEGAPIRRVRTKQELVGVVEPFLASWKAEPIPPKAHMSSPRDEQNMRAHADYVQIEELLPLLDTVRDFDVDLDVMIEAKRKDEALFALMRKLAELPFVKVLSGGCILYRP